MTSAQKEHLRLLHCDCQYKWLRVYLKKNPDLIAEEQKGEILDVGGLKTEGANI